IGPLLGPVVPHIPPVAVIMERTPDAGAFHRYGIAVALKPQHAVPTAHALLDERIPIDRPRVPRVPHAGGFVDGDAKPLLDRLHDALARLNTEEFSDFPVNRLDFVLMRALAAQHAFLAVWVSNVERQGRSPLAVLTLQARLPDIALGHAVDGDDV